MDIKYFRMISMFLVLAPVGIGLAQEATPTPAVTTMGLEEQKLDVERLQLENEKLKLEIEKMRLAATAEPAPAGMPPSGSTPIPNKDALLDFEQAYSDKAKALSKAHANESDLMVLDFVNAEIWYKGVRYGVYELYNLADEQKLKLSKSLDERMANGTPRWRYQLANLTLLKYESRDRGILEILPPRVAGDFHVLTPEGLSFDSNSDDVRDNAKNPYFEYKGEGESRGLRVLRYEHGQGLAFSNKLEFLSDRDGKICEIRFGSLDEH